MSKAIVYFADGTEECEALLVVDLLRRAGVHTVTASAMGRREVTTSHGIVMQTDALTEELDIADADLLVLPGGVPGTPNLAANPAVMAAVQAQYAAGKKLAAICAAPSILGGLGMLDGRKATAHAAFQNQLGKATVLDTEVVVDGNITTSYGLGGAIPFALELVRQLAGAAEAEKIQSAIAYRH